MRNNNKNTHSTHTTSVALTLTPWVFSAISATLWFTGVALMATLFFMTGSALADIPKKAPNPVVASLPGVENPVLNYVPPTVPKSEAINLRGACVDGYVVFSVKNGGKPWDGRGFVRITDARTGEVLRERKMRFASGQTGSFRVEQKPGNSMYYTLKVTLPGGKMTYVKSFRGHCVLPTREVRKAMR